MALMSTNPFNNSMVNGRAVAGVAHPIPTIQDPDLVEQMVTIAGKVTLKSLLVKHQLVAIPLHY